MTDYVIIVSTKDMCSACINFKLSGSLDRFNKAASRFGDKIKLVNDDYSGTPENWKISHPSLVIDGVPTISILKAEEFNDKTNKLPSLINVPLHQIMNKSVDNIYDVLKQMLGIEKTVLKFSKRKEIKKGETTELDNRIFSSLISNKENIKAYGFPEGAVKIIVEKNHQHLPRL